jgi:hypothetical protein
MRGRIVRGSRTAVGKLEIAGISWRAGRHIPDEAGEMRIDSYTVEIHL